MWNDKKRQGSTKQDNKRNYSQQFTLTGIYKNLLNQQWGGGKGVTKNTEWCPSIFTVTVILFRLLRAMESVWVKKPQAELLLFQESNASTSLESNSCFIPRLLRESWC